MIEQANSLNQQTSYEQLTRNSGNSTSQKVLNTYNGGALLGHSDRKQLSTVEEENPSQCSDFTSFHQHASRFLQTQHSNRSKRSLRNSIPANVSHSMQGFQINEEPGENELPNPAHENMLSVDFI